MLLLFQRSDAYSKDTFNDNNWNAGHADDISKLLTGKGYWNNSGNHKLFTILTGFAHIMYLTVDSTKNEETERPADNVNMAIKYLKDHQRELKINRIPNISKFLTPGGPYHGWYTHLGWDHIYDADTTVRWRVRQEILRDALAKQFSFSIFNQSKKNSMAALLYYTHILGDHENNALTTSHTRIPIKTMYEQDISDEFWNRYGKEWKPETNIIAELNMHLGILFKDQIESRYYVNLLRSINGYLPENQKEKARWILDALFNNVPYLLRNESFARNFYLNN